MRLKKPETDVQRWHRLECEACPLNHADVLNPKMSASGSKKPVVYMLGEAPGREEDFKGRQFVGKSGRLLRKYIPEDWLDYLRWNNVIRTRPPENRTPERIEIECCRPSIQRDIERSKPRAIFGFGGIPLEWATGATGIMIWRGRRMPVKIGNHACWFYFMLHPSFVLRSKDNPHDKESGDSEFAFALDIRRAFAELENLPDPFVHDESYARRGIEWATGKENGDLRKVISYLDWAKQQPVVGMDYETSCLRPYQAGAKILTVGLGTPTKSLAFAFEHKDSGWKPEELETLRAAWCDFLVAPNVRKAVHNLSFEMEWTAFFFGRDKLRASLWEDSQSQAYVLDERRGKGKPGAQALELLCLQHFGINLKGLSTVNRRKMAEEPLEKILPYNALDAKYHCLLYAKQKDTIDAEGLTDIYMRQLRRVPTTVLTQIKGLVVDQRVVRRLQKKYANRIAEIDAKLKKLKVVRAFEERQNKKFNPQSNPQLLVIFRDMLKRREGERWGGKKYSVDEETLKAVDHPIAKLLLARRKAQKLISTYVHPLDAKHKRSLIFPDGLLHPILNTTFTDTGRLSSESPNEQNFPKRDGEQREVRKQIVAPPGYMFVSIDYGQIEARVIGMASKDKTLVKSLWEDYDIHMEWAQRIAQAYPRRIGGRKFLKDPKVMKDFRTDVKNQWTFPLFFGAALDSAAGYLEIPAEVLSPLYDEFWSSFGGVLEWQERLVSFYEKHGYVETLTGRRRRAPISRNMLINSPIQGTAADIVIDAMDRISETEDWRYQPILNIHDDLTFCFREKRIDDDVEFVVGKMLKCKMPFLNVPLQVEVAVGPNWCDMEDVGKFRSDRW